MSTPAALHEREVPALSTGAGVLIVLGAGVFFSFGGLAFRSVDIGPWEYLFFRGTGMVASAILLLVIVHRSRIPTVLSQVEPMHVLAGVVLGALNILFIVALSGASVAFVLVLQTMAPITAAYFSWVLLRERPAPTVLVATAVSLIGVVIMVWGSITDDISPVGLLAVLIPVGFGVYSSVIRSVRRIDPLVPITIGGLALVVTSSIVVQSTGGFEASARDAAIGLFAGSVLLAIPLSAYNVAQRVVPAPDAALLLMGEVVLAPLWVWLFVDETVAVTTLIGGAIILSAVVWVTRSRRPPRGRRLLTSRG